jgi:hypothetical protein
MPDERLATWLLGRDAGAAVDTGVAGTSSYKHHAIVIGDERNEESHQVGDRETKGSNRKVGPYAASME